MLHTGYLTASSVQTNQKDVLEATLFIPNREVVTVYTGIVRNWFKVAGSTLSDLLSHLVCGDVPRFAAEIQKYLLVTGSCFDCNRHTPEQVFHVFMLGILVEMRHAYSVYSNRESGDGRADVLLIPKDSSGQIRSLVLEFKSCQDKSELQRAAGEALAQIETKKYAAPLGSNVLKIGLTFCAKEVAFVHGPEFSAR